MKTVRLIELFAGVGSQAMAMRDIGVPFEHYRAIEFDRFAMASYNAIHGTDFPVTDVTQVKGEDLGIVDTDEYTYLLTYSFPCQDISVAGKGAGYERGKGTRSGLLWEVERLLNEVEHLPQILLMENVPQVHSKKNLPLFEDWCASLENMGYVNYWQDLNAKDYGVAQNRNRCFMVSILNGYKTFSFPKAFELDKCMKDYLEEEVEDKFYINNEKTQKLINKLIENGTLPSNNDKETVDLCINEPRGREVANCIKARYDAGVSNQRQDGTGVCEKEE